MRRPLTKTSRVAVATIVGLAAASAAFRPDRALRVLTGFVSHTLCSDVFVSGLPPDQVYAEVVRPRPGLGLFSWAIRQSIDHTGREARTTLAGGFESRARHHEQGGCLVVLDPPPRLSCLPSRTPPRPWNRRTLR